MNCHGWGTSSRGHANRRRLPRTQSHLHTHSNPSGKRQSAGPSGRSRRSLPSTTVATAVRLVHNCPALLHNVPLACSSAYPRRNPFNERGRFPHCAVPTSQTSERLRRDVNASMAFKKTLSPSHVLPLLMGHGLFCGEFPLGIRGSAHNHPHHTYFPRDGRLEFFPNSVHAY